MHMSLHSKDDTEKDLRIAMFRPKTTCVLMEVISSEKTERFWLPDTSIKRPKLLSKLFDYFCMMKFMVFLIIHIYS